MLTPVPVNTRLNKTHLIIAQTAIALAIFVTHYRPWQGGLLEEWGLTINANDPNFRLIMDYLPGMMGRPFHLFPHALGYALSLNGVWGTFFVLGAAAVITFLAASWALQYLIPNRWLALALAALLGFHPWWQGGYILRFLPAVSALMFFTLWFAFVVRYIYQANNGFSCTWWLVAALAAIPIGILTYQAFAGVYFVAVLALWALVRQRSDDQLASRKKFTLAGLLSVGLVLLSIIWTVFIAQFFSRDGITYELNPGDRPENLWQAFRAYAGTLIRNAPYFLLLALVIAIIAFIAFRRQQLGWPGLLALAVATAAGLGTGLVFLTSLGWLRDTNRVAMAIGASLWVALVVTLSLVGLSHRWAYILAGLTLVLTLPGVVMAYATWTNYARTQQSVMAVTQPFREATPPGQVLVVVDHSGLIGSEYTFVPPHLYFALWAQYGDGAQTVLCVPGSARSERTWVQTCEHINPWYFENALNPFEYGELLGWANPEVIIPQNGLAPALRQTAQLEFFAVPPAQ